MKININVKAKVKLTAKGAECLNNYNRQFHISGDYVKDETMFPTNYAVEDIYEDQLWSIMHIFGSYLHMGTLPVFNENIIEIIES